MKKLFFYTMRLSYLGGFGIDLLNKKKWYRDFAVTNLISLEVLHSIIQTILGWDDSHLYIFKIKEQNFGFFGVDYPIVIDSGKMSYTSCDVKIEKLNLSVDETFFYDFDFGDHQKFSIQIKIVKKVSTKGFKRLPVLLSYKGKNIRQYPDTELDSFIEYENYYPNDNLFSRIDYIDYAKENRWVIRFIQKDDFEILEEWRKSKDKRKWERAVVILENWNLSLKALSFKIERPISTIKTWIEEFNASGLGGISIKRKKRDESKRKGKIEQRTKRIIEILHQKPTTFKINRSVWSLDSLANAYEKQFNEKISRTTIGRSIQSAGYNIKKARNVLTSPDPDYKDKVERLLKILWSIKSDEDLFFIDELGPLRVKKYGGRCYTKKGETLTIPQNQFSKGSITLSGALSATTNQVTWNYGNSKDTSAMIDLIEILFNQYHDKSKIFITWDAASWHSSNELIEWLNIFNETSMKLGENPIIEFIPLPSNSQFLNVIESVFSGMKRAVIHHSNYLSEEEMKSAISLHFQERNEYFLENPKRAGKKIWEIDFFKDYNNLKSGDYREW